MTRLERARKLANGDGKWFETPPPDWAPHPATKWVLGYPAIVCASLALDGYPARWPHKRPAAPKEETPR